MTDGQKHSPDESSWFEYRRLVLNELERLNKNIIALGVKIDAVDGIRSKEISDLRVEIGMIKGKSAAYGFMAGSIVSIITAIIVALLRHH